MFKQVTM